MLSNCPHSSVEWGNYISLQQRWKTENFFKCISHCEEMICCYKTRAEVLLYDADYNGLHITSKGFTPFLLTNSRSISRHRIFLSSGGSGVSPGWDGRSWRCQCQLSSTQDGPPGRRYRPRCIWRLAPWNQSQPQLFYRGQPRWNLGTADTLTGPHLEQDQTEQMVGMDRQICRYVWGCGSVLPGQKLSWHMALTEGMWFGRT